MKLSGLLTLAFVLLLGSTTIFAQTVDIKAEIIHGQTFISPTLSFTEGAELSIGKIELKGKWEGSAEPTPTQTWTWFQDEADDCPQATLDWTNVTMDTTWIDNSDGTFSIKQDLKNKYDNGIWSDLKMPQGWLSPDSVYMIEIQSVVSAVATELVTLTFDTAGTVDFKVAEFKIKYEGTKEAAGLQSAKSETMLKFEGSSQTFSVPNDVDYLRVNWKNGTGTFYTVDFPVTIVTAAEMGLNVATTPGAYPAEGYFSAGDTIDVIATFTNDGGTELIWNEANANGLEKFEFYFSGAKQNYATIYEKIKVIDKFSLKNNPATGLPYANPIRLALPETLPGVGTYTLLVKAKRVFGTTVEKIVLQDIQVGTVDVTNHPVANCESCHSGDNELSEHGATGYEQCLVCHVDNMGAAFSKITHEIHMPSADYKMPIGSCTTCHVNDTQDQFTAYADQVCNGCHTPVPYFPSDHAENVPLHAESGMSCGTMNCHSSGSLGVFKTIKETHAGLAGKYVGGTLTAKATDAPPTIDGVVDDTWNDAAVITTLKGVELRAMYDDNNLYMLAKWIDGHNLYTGEAGPTESIDKNMWSYSDTTWAKSGNEDRFAIMFETGNDLGAGCSKMCHSSGEHKTAGGNVDVWHWKSARTNPISLADDKWWSQDGRGSDAGIVGAYMDNINGTGDGPNYSGPVTDGHFIIIPIGGSVNDLETSIDVNNSYPGYVLDANAEGSRWDVIAKGVFSSDSWTLELQRPLATGNADDVEITHSSSIKFSTATFDNTGGGHAAQGIDVGEYTLVIGGPLGIDQGDNLHPYEYNLGQNYPNPFNPISTISFELKENSHISIEIFNVLGQKVRSLADKKLMAGRYEVQVDGTGLSSGVYYYRMIVQENASGKIAFQKVNKMILMK